MRGLFPKTEFGKNVLTMMTGTSIAQAIPVAISPILTRLYSPNDFGLFAAYSAILAILASISTGRYELAIMIPQKDEEALSLVKASFLVSLSLSIICFWVIYFFQGFILQAIGNKELAPWLYVLPPAILVSGTYQVLNYWVNRHKGFKKLALSRVAQSSSNAGVSVGAGVAGVGVGGLVFGGLLGRFSACVVLLRKILTTLGPLKINTTNILMWKQMKEYRKFPMFDVPTVLTNLSANQAPNILLSGLFGPAYAGFYYLTQRVLQAPITVISTSVLDVFKEDAARSFREKGEAREIYLSTLKSLFAMAIVPSVLLFLFAVPLFRFVFGNEWSVAGEYARVLSPALAFRFIVNPLSFMLYIAESQKINLLTMMLLLLLILASLYVTSSSYMAVVGISASYVLYYVVHLGISAYLAGVFRGR